MSGSKLQIGLLLAVVVAGCGQASAPAPQSPVPAETTPSDSIPLCGAATSAPGPCRDWAPTPAPSVVIGTRYELGGNCHEKFSTDRCEALAFGAAQELQVDFGTITSVDVVPNPDPSAGIDFAHRTFLEVGFRDGSHTAATISCPGIAAAFDPPCMPVPVVPLAFPGGPGSGYRDTPENATPFPSLEASAVAGARPLEVKARVVPVAKLGPQTITLGQALLPNGYLASANLALSDPWPSDVIFQDGVQLVLSPAAGGPPLENLYDHGWHPGDEAIVVLLTFDVAWFEPGASFTVVDVVVR
ncbi:MAG TPA: hypothetical protein VKR30_03435 [Candidatus Limnocylindrales bacterium]|nr:hypothetical protein [Candidatus Limnocylindrales bacterium]